MTVSAKTWARIGAAAFVAFGVAVSALGLRTGRQTPVAIAVPAVQDLTSADPLAAELHRCQALGEAGASDPGCLAAWAENRRRFLTPGAAPEAPAAPTSMFPATASSLGAAAPKDGRP